MDHDLYFTRAEAARVSNGVVSSPDYTPSPIARESLMTLVDFLGPRSNIFPGMSGIESDWSEGQLLRNANHIDRMMALKMPRYDCIII